MRALTLLFAVAALAIGWLHHEPRPVLAQDAPEKKFEDFDKLTKGAKVHEGLFTLYQKDDKLYAEIKMGQFDKLLLCPIAIARGMGLGGYTLNFDEQWVLYFKRLDDKVQLIRRNVRFQAKKGSPVAHAVETTYTDSILMALKIQSINPKTQGVLINLNDIFMGDFAQLGLGSFDASRSSWHKVKAFPKNIEIEVAATYSGGGRRGSGAVIDSRGTTVVLHYGLSLLPDDGYKPRFADDRVGYFLSVVKDFSSDNKDNAYLRYVNRWRLERADGLTLKPGEPVKLSPPKKKIVFWIEKSVPDEYRRYVREGILEWNKAFEAIGFRDAIEVRQQESEDFDPEDINYNTFRWIATDRGFAMGPSRTNPLTGEILDADILFDASMVRFYKQEYRIFRGTGQAFEPASSIQAGKLGWLLPSSLLDDTPLGEPAAGPRSWNDRADPRSHLWAIRQGICQCGTHKSMELALAAMMLADEKDKGKDGKKDERVPEELIGQAIKEVTMHEVGHTLGLRHNFKASTMLKNDQLHDTAITRQKGLTGSVMDYAPVNLAPKGTKQGDYFSTTIGPYDYWAIEYAYRPLPGGTEGEFEELQKIAAKCAAPGHDFATDEDLFGTADPLVNMWDLGSDPMKFAQDRILIAEELFKNLPERVVEKGEGYQRVRQAFNILLNQYGNAAFLVASQVGGEYMHRDHAGDPDGRDPFVPVPAAKQREALKFLQEHILTDQPYQFSPDLLRKLGADRWWHWGNDHVIMAGVDYPLHERILRIQKIVLGHMLEPAVMNRIQNNALKAGKDEQPLTLAETFRGVTDAVWSDLPAKGKEAGASSVIRRNLQREHLKELTQLVLGQNGNGGGIIILGFGGVGGGRVPPDARSLARLHLRDLNDKIAVAIKAPKLDDTSRAHLQECSDRIAKVLTASMQVHEP